ncbi:hypothetical protein CTAYLR_001777 [Chrysophaeum taylorii]|uniref:Mitochondrial inner membrane protease subunit n=1 Tax=Chrysophaeum taylorii TaxID=2483200 RepID=A0AAD7UFH6_9STRA|nr:hypothetical protein CTAYLR_001777 [Chrysophaeum taylorii]
MKYAWLFCQVVFADAWRPPSTTPKPPLAATTKTRKKMSHVIPEREAMDPRQRLEQMTSTFDNAVAEMWPDRWLRRESDRAKLGAALRFYVRLILVSFMIRWFVVEPRYIPSNSMVPTFQIGDQLAVEKVSTLVRVPKRNEVILFRPPPKALARLPSKKATQVYVKRVVGEAGDLVEIRDGIVFVNNRPQTSTVADAPKYTWGPHVVPPDCLFVLGDNRNRSFDSHVWGFLPVDHVIGHAILRYWPLDRFGLVEY